MPGVKAAMPEFAGTVSRFRSLPPTRFETGRRLPVHVGPTLLPGRRASDPAKPGYRMKLKQLDSRIGTRKSDAGRVRRGVHDVIVVRARGDTEVVVLRRGGAE